MLDVTENLEDHEVLSIFYLRKCRSIFTIKRDLETIKRKNQNPHNEEDEDFIQATTKRNVTPPTRVYSKDCIFCERVKYIRSTSSREPLVKAAQLRVDQTLREKALAKCDQKILDVTSRDIVAAQAHYHRSCYRDYTRPEKPSPSSSSTAEVRDDAEEKAFSDLFKYIQLGVIEKKINCYNDRAYLKAQGKEKLSEATRKHIRRKIEAEFGSILLIFLDDKGKLIVVPENLNAEDIVKMNLVIKKELHILKHHSSNIGTIIDQSSTYIRNSVLDMKWKSPWPIHLSDVNIRSFPVPESLKLLLMSVLTADVSNPSKRNVNLAAL